MNIGLFGGTFDPIHRGHLALARAARERCKLSRILFVPADVPPHKQLQPLSVFAHRYAMIALATAQEKDFVPSLLEAPEDFDGGRTEAKAETRLRNQTTPSIRSGGSSSRSRKRTSSSCSSALMPSTTSPNGIRRRRCFGNVSLWWPAGPGFRWPMSQTRCPRACVPGRKSTRPFHKQAATGDLVLNGVTIHLLDKVDQPISSTSIREAAAAGKPLGRFLEPAVAEYIKKVGLYKRS